ncbi:iron-containing alcohol dehydrogenase family protein [Marinifilum sp.]|uniref:iron-containing alcohol dehydrogenase family protein n=1 Tax=Marinifilum sp. TaxID=2033137 RepID=UPI003BAAA2A3
MYQFAHPGHLIFGLGSVKKELLKEVERFSLKNILVVTDKILVKTGVTKTVTDILIENNISFSIFDEVLPDNPSHIIEKAIKDMAGEKIDGIIAVGGGSTMDCAKAMDLMLTLGLDNLDKHFTTRTGYWCTDKLLPLIAIPTTAGTGSEASPAAGIKDVEKKRKESIYGPGMIPTIAIVDGELHKGMPASVSMSTGLDALSHALEALYSKERNNLTKTFGLQAIRLIVENLPKAVADGSNLEARQNMAEASTLAIFAGMQGMTHIGHGIAHAIGGQWNIPHGVAVAHVLFPMVEYLADGVPDSTADLLNIFGVEAGENPGKALADAMRKFAEGIGLPKLSEFEKTNLDELEIVVKNAQGFIAPREAYLVKGLPSNEWIESAIRESI